MGNCQTVLRQIKESGTTVQTAVTSPPYFGQRDYGVGGQIGLEKTPQEYINNLVDVFSLVKDILSDDGVLFLNLGDSYARQGGRTPGVSRHWDGRERDPGGLHALKSLASDIGCKPKNLLGIPFKVAFALQDSGWILRQVIIWAKGTSGQRELQSQVYNLCIEEGIDPEVASRVADKLEPYVGNPMPESVKDRFVTSHEYIFLFAKSQRYYFDLDAVREPHVTFTSKSKMKGGRNHLGKRGSTPEDGKFGGSSNLHDARWDQAFHSKGRNRRTVWTVPTKAYRGSHMAVFPPDLIEPCILAGSRPGDIVLDPFMGSGTVAGVAEKLGRKWIGIELNDEYASLVPARIKEILEKGK
jgi:site-specific DNA-methyltransferase (adenine-specific)